MLIAAKGTLPSTQISAQYESFEIIAIQVHFEGIGRIRILCVYLPPNTHPNIMPAFFSTIQSLVSSKCSFLLLGDFNLPLVNWSDFCFPENEKYQLFKKFLLNLQPIHQLICFPTRNNNLLDLAITNAEKLLRVVSPLPNLGSSDHIGIALEIDINRSVTPILQHKKLWKGDYNSISTSLLSRDFSFMEDRSLEHYNCGSALKISLLR